MRGPSPGCASTSTSMRPRHRSPAVSRSPRSRSIVSSTSVSTTPGQPLVPPRRHRRRHGETPERRQLQLCQVDVGEGAPRQIVCGAWNFGVGATVAVGLPGVQLPGFPGPLDERPLRGEVSRGMILAEDEIGLGSDHSGIMLLPDGIEPGTPLAEVLPVHEQVLDVTPTLNRVDLLSMVGLAREVATLFDGDLLESRSTTRRSCTRNGSTSRSTTPADARAISPECSRASPSHRRRCGCGHAFTQRECDRSRTSST